jgi:hypothetical protein
MCSLGTFILFPGWNFKVEIKITFCDLVIMQKIGNRMDVRLNFCNGILSKV